MYLKWMRTTILIFSTKKKFKFALLNRSIHRQSYSIKDNKEHIEYFTDHLYY